MLLLTTPLITVDHGAKKTDRRPMHVYILHNVRL